MSTLGQLDVKLRLDASGFNAGLSQAQGALGKLSGALGAATQVAIGFGAAIVGLRAIDSAVGAAKDAVIGFNASLEQSRIAFTTMLKSGEAAQAFLFDLQQFAAQTPFEFQDVERGAKRLLAMGFAAKDVKPLLTAVGDAAAALGLGAPGIDRITLALGQMQAKAKVSAEEMLQLTEAGIPAWEILAEAVGKPIPEVMKLAEQGKIASQVFIDAFQRFSQQNWGGMMEQQSRTFLGALSTIKDSLLIVASTAFKPLFDRISELAQRIAEFVQSDQFQAWGARVAATIDVILEGLGLLGDGFRVVFSGIASVVITVGQIIYEALQLLNPFARHSPSLVESVSQGVDIIISKFASLQAIEAPLRAAGDAIQALGEAARAGMQALAEATLAAQMQTVSVFGAEVPAAFAAAQAAVQELEAAMAGLQSEIEAQESVLAGLKAELDSVSAAIRAKESAIRDLERQMRAYDEAVDAARANVERIREEVDKARGVVDGLKDALSAAQDRLRQLTEAPIEGTKEFDDKLFDLNQQINQTQLQLTKLKLSGAPREQVQALEDQLEKLRLQAEQVRLEKSLKLDPLRRQISELAKPVKELPFEEIIKGIKAEQENISRLQAQLGPATAEWQRQSEALRAAEAQLKAAQAAREEFRKRIDAERLALENLRTLQAQIQERYAAEQQRLSELKDAYSALKQQTDEYRKSIEEVLKAAEQQARLNEQAAKAAEKAAAAASALAVGLKDRTAGLDLSEARRQLEEWRAQFEAARSQLREQMMPTFEQLRGSLQSVGESLRSLSDTLAPIKDDLAKIAAVVAGAGATFLVLNGIVAPLAASVLALRAAFVAAGGVLPGIVSLLGGPLTLALAAIALAVGALYVAWRNNWLGIGDIINSATTSIRSWIEGRLGKVITWLEQNLPLIQEVFGKVLSFIRDNLVLPWLQSHEAAWQQHLGTLQAVLETAWTIITVLLDTFLQNMLSLIRTVLLLMNRDWQAAWDEVRATAERTWEAIKTIVGLALDTIYNALVKPALERLRTEWEQVWSAVKQIAEDIWAAISNTVRTGVNTVVKAFNKLIDAWNKLEFRIPGFDVEIPSVDVPGVGRVGGGRLGWPGIAISPVKLAPIPELASGGLVTRPTLALLGEAGPEAVVPLRGNPGLGNIYVTINVAGSVITERDLAERVREELLRLGRRNLSVGLA